ncbi:hypothetical protein, partial [Burkholderia sp. Cy-637]|uniref:hypothetical protein n=1 Tax=Burkholderia sp. Cy-637 TaxID=2608327 RepID=UPI001424971B
RLDTPFGALTADVRLDGARPFAIAGTAGYSGKVSNEQVDAHAPLSGSLEALVLALDASGDGQSDRRHHALTLERLDTPFGALTADVRLDGARPFAIAGTAGYSGKVSNEQVDAHA